MTPSQRSNLLAATYRGENPTLLEQMALSCETANQSISAAIQHAAKPSKASSSGMSTILNSTLCCSSKPKTISKNPSRLFRDDALPGRMRQRSKIENQRPDYKTTKKPMPAKMQDPRKKLNHFLQVKHYQEKFQEQLLAGAGAQMQL